MTIRFDVGLFGKELLGLSGAYSYRHDNAASVLPIAAIELVCGPLHRRTVGLASTGQVQ
ncbi:hypothetical protein D3C80_1131260 [compost metagenome]